MGWDGVATGGNGTGKRDGGQSDDLCPFPRISVGILLEFNLDNLPFGFGFVT